MGSKPMKKILASFLAVTILVLGASPSLRSQIGGGIAAVTVTGVSTILASVAPLLVSNAGGYIRQDSTGTIAKETGGNLATAASGIGATNVDKCTTSDTTACTMVGLLKGVIYLLSTAVGPASAANSNPFVESYNTLISGAVTSAMNATTSTQVIAGTGSNYQYITQCTTSNGSLTVSTDILLQDGSGGTTLYVLPAPAAAIATTGGGGAAIQFPTPLKVPTVGNGLFAANVTTSSSTKISCSGFRSTISY